MGLVVPVIYEPDGRMEYEAQCEYDLSEGHMTGKFYLRFRKFCIEHVAHECWHLMCRVMQWMTGNQKIDYSQLCSEVYAFNFGKLVDDVFKDLVDMEKMYDKGRKDKETERVPSEG